MNEENEGMLLHMDNDETFREYDQRNDSVIHCDSEEYKELLMKKLESGDDAKDTHVPGKWIPCSERLPEKPEIGSDGYIVQTRRVVQPFVGYWDGRKWTDEEDDVVDEVIAWMPLPEPYKEDV